MLVSHRKRFIYTKTTKSAGTSVEVYFEPYCVPEGSWTFAHYRAESVTAAGIVGFRGENREGTNPRWWSHMPASVIKEQVGDDVWNSYFKFCVIRDPFERLVSKFHFDRRVSGSTPNTVCSFKAGAAAAGNERGGPLSPQLRTHFKSWLLRHKMRDRQRYAIEGEICVDYFIRYEALEQGIKHVCDTTGVPFEPEKIPLLKTGLRPQHELADYYDAEAMDFVANEYRFELEHFGYRPPVPT